MRSAPVARAMRPPAVLLLSAMAALVLAGCAVPGEEAEEDDPLFGLCPQWTRGPGGQAGSFVLPAAAAGNGSAAGNASDGGAGPAGTVSHEVVLDAVQAELDGQPLDVVRVALERLDVDGRLSLRAFDAEGDQLAVRDYRQPAPQLVPVVVMEGGRDGDLEFDVLLSSLTHDAPQAPGPVTLRWTLDGAAADVAFAVTYHYKVCGI